MAMNPRDLAAQFQGLTLENVGSWPLVPRWTAPAYSPINKAMSLMMY
jgi:hypothetical protein